MVSHSSTTGMDKVGFLLFLRIRWRRGGFHAWAERKPPWPNRQRKYRKHQNIIFIIVLDHTVWFWSEPPADTFREQARLKLAQPCTMKNGGSDRCLESKKGKRLCLAGETCLIDSPRQQEIRNQLHPSPEKWTTRMPKNTHPALLKVPYPLTQVESLGISLFILGISITESIKY